jgi:SprT protein
MELKAAERLAKDLMREHGVDHWAFIFDNSKKRFGQTVFSYQRISISRYVTALASEEEVRDCILHEIAHVLAGHAAGHGPAWRRVHRAIGGNAKRLHSAETAPARYVGTCPGGHVHKRYRAVTGVHACVQCARDAGIGKRFDQRFVISWVDTQAKATV